MTALRLAWAGPWNERSAIARSAVDVVAALRAAGHSVDVLRTEVRAARELPAAETPAGFGPEAIGFLSERNAADLPHHYDAVIGNSGDDFDFHGALTPDVVLASGAVVVFHDGSLANWCAGWASCFPDPEAALRCMIRSACDLAASIAGEPSCIDPTATRDRPMTELLARVASGAAVHAARHRGRIAGCCPGPVVEIPPSYRDPAVPPRVVAFDGTLTIATIGQTGADARTTEVIRAIGRSPLLRRRVRCRVVGSTTVDERAHLERMVRAYALERVSFIGRIDESALSKELADVDAICCLGPPILEGGPENVAMALLAGRPVLISDGGVHGELPDDVALKCRPGAEADDIARHLEAMLDEPQSILALGARGRAYAQAVHSPMRYASALLDLVNRATEASPWLRTAGQIGSVLANWGIGAGAPAAIAVGKILDDVQDRHVPAA